MYEAALALAHPAWNESGDLGGWWWVWRAAMIVLWVVLIATAIWWFRRTNPRGMRYEPTGVERARDILAERFARGDITTEEYAERLDSLGQLNAATSDRR